MMIKNLLSTPRSFSLCCLSAAAFWFSPHAMAQDSANVRNPWKTHASFSLQTDVHYGRRPSALGDRWMHNTYVTGRVENDYLEFGIRYENLDHPLPGHEEEKGSGIANIFLTGRYQWAEMTLGDFYEQFGSGLLLRSYEDRSLGIDNAIRGARFVAKPVDGLTLKMLGGQQRNHFDRNNRLFNADRGSLWAGDAEVMASQWFSGLRDNDWNISVGASWVTRNEKDVVISKRVNGQEYYLDQPDNVSAYATRLHLAHGNWDVYSEYAYKFADPNATNHYIFRNGNVAMLTASYAQRGFSFLLGARRSVNFDYRSSRSASLNSMCVNYLQPFTKQHTYTLAALYPYATQPNGEWAFQGELQYKWRRGTSLGGRYGTEVKLSASLIKGLDKQWVNPAWNDATLPQEFYGTDGYRTKFFGMGPTYFHDIDIEIGKKLSPAYTLRLAYMNQAYNQRVIEGHADNGDVIHSNIFVYDGKHRLFKQLALNTELQYLHTRQAEGDWLYASAEWAFHARYLLSVSDLWNTGTTNKHYYMVSAAASFGSHRLQLGYGLTRKGINCSGGVCRMMPATEGFHLSYSMNL